MAAVWQRFMNALVQQPDLWLSVYGEAQRKQMEAAAKLRENGEPSVTPPKGDRRFTSPQWQSNPFFSLLLQNYLMNSEALRELVDQVDLSAADKKLLRFAIGQYLDAVSPANFPATNPEVMEETMKTGGENLVAGMQNFMGDMQQGTISHTPAGAFAIGKNIAMSPGKVVAQTSVMQLLEYAPQTAQTHTRPLLVVPPCINKYYILDLQEKNSFIRHTVAAGHRVFLISWINAGDAQQHLTWDDYLREGVFAAIDAVRGISRQDKINLLGFCIGGTMLASALAVLASEGETPAQSLTLLATMLDFSDTGEIGLFIDEENVASQEAKFAHGGIMNGRELARGFSALRPNDLIWPYFINNYYKGKQPQSFDLLFWNGDSTNLPGPMFAEYLRMTYLENRIAKKRAKMCGVTVDLAAVKAPTYAVACDKDHIVPWPAACQSAALLGGKTRFVLAASGHIAGIINPPAANKGWRRSGGESLANPEQWLAHTEQHLGSWWDDWLSWLKKHGGKKMAAPKKFGSARYRPGEDAPGSFVQASGPTDSMTPGEKT